MSEDWRANLPEEIRDNASLKDVADVNALAEQFINAQSRLGNSIRIPGPDAGDEAMTAFHSKLAEKVPGLIPTPDPENEELMNGLYNRMGRPEAATGYDHPEGMDATQMTDFAELAHGLGLTKKQYLGMLTQLVAHTQKEEGAKADALAEATHKLKMDWGIVYEDNLKMVDAVMKGTGAPKHLMEQAASGKLDPETTRWLFNIGNQLGTEGINFNKDESTTRLAPTEALARANEIMADREGPYWDASHPEHKAMVKKVVDLRRAAAAGGLS